MTLAHSGCLSIKTHSVQCRCLSIMSVGTNKGISTIKMLTVWKVGLGEMMQKRKNLYWNQFSNELAFVRAIEPLSIKPLQITKFSRWLSMSSLRHWYLKVSENSHNKHLWIISFCFTQDTRYKSFDWSYLYLWSADLEMFPKRWFDIYQCSCIISSCCSHLG